MAFKKGKFKPQRRRSPFMSMRVKRCRFCTEKLEIDYKNADMLARFATEKGKVLPSRLTGTCAFHQRQICKAIKRARTIALLPRASE